MYQILIHKLSYHKMLAATPIEAFKGTFPPYSYNGDKLPCKGEPFRLSGYRDPLVHTHRLTIRDPLTLLY